MNCEQFEDLLADALGGELSSVKRAGFDGHVRDCARCRREFESASAAISAMRSLPGPPVEAAAVGRDRLASAAESAPWMNREPNFRLPPILRYAAVIALAFIAGYVVRASMTRAISTRDIHPDSLVESRSRVETPESPRITDRFALAHPQSFEAAFAGAHLRDPSRSDLAKCMVAMFGTHR